MICHFDTQMSESFKMNRLRSVVVGHDRLIPVSRPDARGRPLAVLPGQPDAKVPFLGYSNGSGIGKSLKLFLQDKEHFLQPCFETSLAEGVKAMVLEGHGIGWLPEVVVRHELEDGKLVRSGGKTWDVDIDIRTFRPSTRLPKHAERLWEVISGLPVTMPSYF